MKNYIRTATSVGAAAAMFLGLSTTTNAQRAVPRQPRNAPAPIQRPRPPVNVGVAVQRAPGHLSAGVSVQSRNFQLNVQYRSGIPFFGGYPGHVLNGFWHPGYFSNGFLTPYYPQMCSYRLPLPPDMVRAIQWNNIAQYRSVPYGSPQPADNSREVELERELSAERERRARAEGQLEGYRQAMEERPRMASEVLPEFSGKRTHTFGYAADGCIDPVQFVGEFNSYANAIFDKMADSGERKLHAYTFKRNGKPYIAILDTENNEPLLRVQILDDLQPGTRGKAFVEYVEGRLGEIGVVARNYTGLRFAGHSAVCPAK